MSKSRASSRSTDAEHRASSRERLEVGRGGGFFGWMALVILGGPLVWLLGTAGPDFQTHRMERWSWDDGRFLRYASRVRSLPMERSAEGLDGFLHTVEFVETDGMPRQGLRSVELLFDVRKSEDGVVEEKGTTRLTRGEVSDLDTGEVWHAKPVRGFRTEQMVMFQRPRAAGGGAQNGMSGSTTNGMRRWRVNLWTHEPVHVGVRCHLTVPVPMAAPPAHPGEWAYRVPVSDTQVRWAYPHGRYTTWTEGEPLSRARVVGAMWDREGSGWVWGWMGVALGLVVSGVVGLVRRVDSTVPMGAWRAGICLGLVFGGIGLMQLILHPAFQGTDEPPHVMSWHVLAKDDVSVTNSWDFGRRVHYDRLMGRSHQQITTADVGHPHEFFVESLVNWGLRPLARSTTAARVSQAGRWWVEGEAPAVQVFRMRALSLGMVTLAVMLAGAMLARGEGVRAGEHWLGLCFLMVPSLGYFAMNVSNYPILLACYVVLGAGMASMVNRSETGWRVMLLMGVTLGILVQTSVNGVLMSVVPLAGLLGVALFRFAESTEGESVGGKAVVGWKGWAALGVGLLLARVISSPAYDAAVAGSFEGLLKRVGWSWLPSYWMLVVVGSLGLWLVERLAVMGRLLRGREGRGKRIVWLEMVALAMLLGMAWNAFTPAPHLGMLMEAVPGWEYLPGQERLLPQIGLPAPPDPAPLPWAYVRSVLASFFSSWGPGDADYMTSTLFWQLDGYLDTLMPSGVRQFVTTLLVCGLAVLLWRISERRTWGRLGRLAMTLGGLFAALVLLALGSKTSVASPSIHGRYLMGVYVLLIPVAFLGWKGLMVRWESRSPRKIAFLLVVPMLLLQAAGIVTTIHRYFG